MHGPLRIPSDLVLLGIWCALDIYKRKFSKHRFLQNVEFFGGNIEAVISTIVFAYYNYPAVAITTTTLLSPSHNIGVGNLESSAQRSCGSVEIYKSFFTFITRGSRTPGSYPALAGSLSISISSFSLYLLSTQSISVPHTTFNIT